MARARDVIILLLAAETGALSMFACGGIVGLSAQTRDAGRDASTSVDAVAADAAEASVFDLTDSSPDVADAAPCLDDAAPESGEPFSCNFGPGAPRTCWSGLQFCSASYNFGWSAGWPPKPGCYPLPCGCGAEPSCACLGLTYGGGAGCSDNGGIMVWGPNGIQ
jgi:hypothetical protein